MKIRLILFGLAASAALCAIAGTARAQIFVTNFENGTIGEYTTSGATVNAALVSGLGDPRYLAVSGGNLFVTNVVNLQTGQGVIGEYNATTGATVNAALVSGLNVPSGIVVSGGNLFVANTFAHTIGEYNAITGAAVNAAFVSDPNGPRGLAVSGGNLFVANFATGTIGEYNATTGAPVNTALVSGLSGPEGIVASGGNLFVANLSNNTIGEYNATTGAPVNTAVILGLNSPAGIAVSGGSLFVANEGGTIGEYNAMTGASINPSLVSGLNSPMGIAVVPHGSATWSLSPGSGDWNTAGNWNPATVPNGPADTATFGVSHTTGVSISANTEVSGIVFNSGASAFTITANPTFTLTVSGVGITNNSGVTQNFVTGVDSSGNFGDITFTNSATAGNMTVITNNGATVSGAGGGVTSFVDSSTAGSATINNNGGTVSGAFLSQTNFGNTSTAGSATINNNAATVTGAASGGTFFVNSSSAGSATINNNGGTVSNGTISGGFTEFRNTATAASATLIANSGTSGGNGGTILFEDDSSGGTARVEVFGNGNLDISDHNAPGVAIGSIEGTGNVFLGANNLTVGSNNLSTTLSGVIQDGGFKGGTGGSLTKIGTATLTLSGANIYTGPTAVNAGVLNVTGSITSAVTVNGGGTLGPTHSLALTSGGTLSGGGTTGSVTVNSGGKVAPSGQHRESPPPAQGVSFSGSGAAVGAPQALHVNGDYVQNGGGTLQLVIGGTATGTFDQVIVTGSIRLLTGSILDLDFVNGFAPTKNEVFDLLSSGTSSITGNFTTVNIEGLKPGFEFDLGPGTNGHFDLTALNNGVPASLPDMSSTATLLMFSVTALFGLKVLLGQRA